MNTSNQEKESSYQSTSGLHMIMDIKDIQNEELLNDCAALKILLDMICTKYEYNILQKNEHIFQPQGCTILYLLSESHISIHTFPEKNYLALDIYTCRNYTDHSVYLEIYEFIIAELKAKKETPIIIDRCFY